MPTMSGSIAPITSSSATAWTSATPSANCPSSGGFSTDEGGAPAAHRDKSRRCRGALLTIATLDSAHRAACRATVSEQLAMPVSMVGLHRDRPRGRLRQGRDMARILVAEDDEGVRLLVTRAL